MSMKTLKFFDASNSSTMALPPKPQPALEGKTVRYQYPCQKPKLTPAIKTFLMSDILLLINVAKVQESWKMWGSWTVDSTVPFLYHYTNTEI